MVQGVGKVILPNLRFCDKCGRVTLKSIHQHYINGHLHCECGRNVDECCQGETANELYD